MADWSLPSRLEGRPLVVARLAWLLVATGLTMLGTVGLARAMVDPMLIELPSLTRIFRALGLNFHLMIVLALVTPFVVAVLVCGLVFWRRSHDPMALLFTVTLLAFHVLESRSPVTFEADPVLRHSVSVVYAVVVLGVTLVLGLFPNGRFVPRSARWLPLAVTALVVAYPDGGGMVMALLDGDTLATGRARGLLLVFSTALVLGLLAQVYRYRKVSTGVEKQQAKWVVVPFGLLFVDVTVAVSLSLVLPTSYDRLVGWVLFASLPLSILFPLMVANAVLRYRLYDIDLVINRSVLFLMLAGFITSVYALVVVGIGGLVGTQGDLGLSIAASALVAVAFEPVRLRAQRWANRLAYGDRATPYEVLSDLTQRLTSTESTQGLLDRTAQRLAEGTGAERATVWVVEGELLRLAGQWPGDAALAPHARWDQLPGQVSPIASDHRRLGAISIEKRRGDPITPTEERLIEDLAGSSASVLLNVSLQEALSTRAEELAASRRRLMEIQDLERKRMERQLDEGAQQLVVSLKVKLDVAARLAATEGVEPLAQMLREMAGDAREAIRQIRSLARGLYPALLEAEGLAAAIRSIADLAPVPVEIEANGIDRLPAELEAAVFFCISEAITNSAKHAPGRPVRVRVSSSGDRLHFEVEDQGPGFDPAKARAGSGLRNMADRIDAVGGSLEVASRPGRGTRVRGSVPLRGLDPVPPPAFEQGVGIEV
jgi:signal transduction histidine kinase